MGDSYASFRRYVDVWNDTVVRRGIDLATLRGLDLTKVQIVGKGEDAFLGALLALGNVADVIPISGSAR